MINVKNISKSYKDAIVLNNVSLEINKGDFTAFMGPSGSGKSTLLYSISSMDNPDEGEVIFEGIDVYKLSESESYQNFVLIKWVLYSKILKC